MAKTQEDFKDDLYARLIIFKIQLPIFLEGVLLERNFRWRRRSGER